MKAGPKSAPKGAPLHLSSLPASGSARVIRFIERYCRVPKSGFGIKAGTPVRLRPWQIEVIEGIYDANPRPRQALVSIARKNGKSLLAACLVLYHLLADGEEGAEILLASSDEKTARVVFLLVRRMIELEPRLSGVLQVYQSSIYHPATDSVVEVLSGEASRAQGRNPTLSLVDEVHVTDPDLWDALATAGGARERPLVLGISTEGPPDDENLMSRLVTHGRAGDDDDFYFREFTAPVGCATSDRDAWRAANPQLGDTLSEDHLAAIHKTTREPMFRRYHLNQRVNAEGQWLPPGAWSACADKSITVPNGTEVVLALDGSYNGDATALVGCTISPKPHVFVVGYWQPEKGSTVPVLEVEDAIRAACFTYNVWEACADPYRWQRSIEVLQEAGLPVLAFPQSPQRMVPATTKVYEAVLNRELTHDGNKHLAEHVSNARVRDDGRGAQLSKQHKHSPKRIDLIVSAVMAHSRASFHARQAPPTKSKGRVISW